MFWITRLFPFESPLTTVCTRSSTWQYVPENAPNYVNHKSFRNMYGHYFRKTTNMAQKKGFHIVKMDPNHSFASFDLEG